MGQSVIDRELEKIRALATSLRDAIDQAKLDQSDIHRICDWPRNCCDCYYLMFFLVENGYDEFQQISCSFASPLELLGGGISQAHGWYLVRGVTVDITLDQFREFKNQRVVAERMSTWHFKICSGGTIRHTDVRRNVYERFMSSPHAIRYRDGWMKLKERISPSTL